MLWRIVGLLNAMQSISVDYDYKMIGTYMNKSLLDYTHDHPNSRSHSTPKQIQGLKMPGDIIGQILSLITYK